MDSKSLERGSLKNLPGENTSSKWRQKIPLLRQMGQWLGSLTIIIEMIYEQ